jgi:hypothetical protein
VYVPVGVVPVPCVRVAPLVMPPDPTLAPLSVNTLTNPHALVVVRDQNDNVAYEPPLPFTTVTVRWAAATCTETPSSVVVHAAHATVGNGFGATVALIVTGAGAAVGTEARAATEVSTGAIGAVAGARLPELGTLVIAGGAATGAALAHPAISTAVATPMTTPTLATTLFGNS